MRPAVRETYEGLRDLVLRGNVLDLAIGITVGAAFNAVVSALVKDLLTPFIAALFKQPDFSSITFTIHGSKFLIGDFVNALVSLLIISITIYFFVILPANRLMARIRKGPPPEATTKQCPECLSNIPRGASRCAFCSAKQSSSF